MHPHLHLASLCLWAALTQTAFAADQVFVTNEGGGSISVIDSKTNTVVHTIETEGKPRGLALCANDPYLYVSNQNGSQLQAIHTQTYGIEKHWHSANPPRRCTAHLMVNGSRSPTKAATA